MILLDKLKRDHINLQRILDLLSRELDRFFAGEESDFDLKIELLDYIEHYAEQVHHPTEDLIYQAVLPKLEAGESLLKRLSREHGELIGMACRFRDTLEGVVQGEVMTREEVETRGREFIALQRHHIDLEETEVFPLLEGALSQERRRDVVGNLHEAPAGAVEPASAAQIDQGAGMGTVVNELHESSPSCGR